MKCSNCQHEQASGKFCGKCGTVLTAHTGEAAGNTVPPNQEPTPQFTADASAPVYQAPTEPNQHVEKVKATSKQYWNYFLQYVKNPGSIVEQQAGQMVNALITLGIFALIFSLAIYKNLSTALQPFNEMGGFFGTSESIMPSYFSVLFTTVFSLGVIFALAAACVYLVNKFAGPDASFASVVTMFGTLTVPSVVLVVAAYLLLLIESLVFGNILLLISLSLTVSMMPMYLITVLLKKSSKAIDSFYAYLSYIVLFSVSFTIVATVFFDSTIGRYIEDLQDLFYF
ncbi:zinc ribbon domain-containing protein [Metaplanococcus flavidus]|uniref:Zinc ribbon domain-containing protein n=1 Tax=Metaplanococcus flavidus TaxID=569883 RepID=A0ABW3LDX8_9BACL